jgi:hypothetical protein
MNNSEWAALGLFLAVAGAITSGIILCRTPTGKALLTFGASVGVVLLTA